MVTAFILMVTAAGKEREVMEKLLTYPEVKEAYVVYGVYDIVAKIIAPDMDKLREVVTWKIRRMSKVRSTVTLIVVEGMEYKR